MESQSDRLTRKIEALKARAEAERKAAGPKINPKAFESDEFLPDGTVKTPVKSGGVARSTFDTRSEAYFFVAYRLAWIESYESTQKQKHKMVLDAVRRMVTRVDDSGLVDCDVARIQSRTD